MIPATKILVPNCNWKDIKSTNIILDPKWIHIVLESKLNNGKIQIINLIFGRNEVRMFFTKENVTCLIKATHLCHTKKKHSDTKLKAAETSKEAESV